MRSIHNLTRLFVVLLLIFGLTASAVGMASAQDITGDARLGVTAALDTDELAQQLVQILKNLLNHILAGSGNLAEALPEECDVTLTGFGFACTLNVGDSLDGVDCNFDYTQDDTVGTCVVDSIARGCISTVVGTTITLDCAPVTMGVPF